jgi:3-hydroxyacyl-CoA dehydrogenase/enoyl-CoA hydratase/3-hydroxybutyryl-CoA epimerase
LTVIALEAARVMEEKIVVDPREADVGSILAFGFAPYTGGALSYIDGIGVKEFVQTAKRLQKKYGAEFKAPKLLLDMADKGEAFYQRFNPYGGEQAKKAA